MSNRDQDEYAMVYPDEDSQWTSAEILGELMGGVYDHGAWIQIHGLDLRLGERYQTQKIWYLYPPDGDEPVDALNLGAFRTASALEEYLKEFDSANPSA